MSEIYFKLCPEGQYPLWNVNVGYLQCMPCNALCKSCIDGTTNGCIDCNSPYSLIPSMMTCQIIYSCPVGTYLDSISGLCELCDTYCSRCVGTAFYCTACKTTAFRSLSGTGCIGICPNYLYGDRKTQLCMS